MKVYECVELVNATNIYGSKDCKKWEIVEIDTNTSNQLIPQLSQTEQSILTVKILAFMAFVFVIKQIKRSI